jgi:hypothetical protein
MMRNKFIHHVPLKPKGVLKKKFMKRRMWYIGSIYRASKGQYMHNKFIKKFFSIHLKFLNKFTAATYNLTFYKLFNQLMLLSPLVNIYANVDKFESKYYNTDIDSNFFNFPKLIGGLDKWGVIYPLNLIILSSGVTYLPIQNYLNTTHQVTLPEESEFFINYTFSYFSDTNFEEELLPIQLNIVNEQPNLSLYWVIIFYKSVVFKYIKDTYI